MATTALKTLYQGESDLITVPFSDSNGDPIPYASIDEVRFVIKDQRGNILLKFKENAPTGWRAADQTGTDGEYQFEILESDTKRFPEGKIYLEWFINIQDADMTDGFKPMGEVYLYDVVKSSYATQ